MIVNKSIVFLHTFRYQNIRLLSQHFDNKHAFSSKFNFRTMSKSANLQAGAPGSGEGGASPHIYRRKLLTESEFVDQKEISRAKWLSMHEITYKDPTGKERKWECVERTTRQPGQVDGVVIMAVLKRVLKYDCVILVKQYRPPMKAYTLEFPAGLIDSGETVETAARRELKEETGYTAQIKHCSPVTCLDPGTENCTVMLATAEIDGDDIMNKDAQPQADEGEFIDVLHIPVNELLEALNEYSSQGLIIDARVYTYAIALTQATKERKLEYGMK